VLTTKRSLTLLAALLAALTLAACGENKDDTSDAGGGKANPPAESTPAPETETMTTEADTSGGSTKVAVSPTKSLSQKPRLARQAGDPPSQLVKDDIVKGKGAVAEAGDTVTVRYVGVRFRDNQQFDASWDRPDNKFDFPLGAGQVIKGWDEGVAGMREGGRRQLTIPPDLGYGAQGAPPDIAPNETLVFVVDLKKVQKG
jgi:peptidylprolyl isomerase